MASTEIPPSGSTQTPPPPSDTSTTHGSNGEPPQRPEPGRDNSIDWIVFGISFALVTVFCILGAIWPERVGEIGGTALDWIVSHLGWIFVLAAAGFVLFALGLALSRYGRIPLSRNNEPPEFSTVSWIAMMFSAGMGIGLIFYGVYEPVWHATHPPPGTNPGNQAEAAQIAMSTTFFHWGLQPWAIYAVVALALAYSTFRMGRGNLLSSPFQALSPNGKDVSERWWGKGINIWAIIGTKFGGATSLGLGALQIAGGLFIIWGIGQGFGQEQGVNLVALVVIVVLVFFAILSAISGVGNGIKWLSNTNMVLAVLLVLFVLVVGPTVYLLNLFPLSVGQYLYNIVPLSFRTPAVAGAGDWFAGWTIFYWAWWISWTPFVSTFIARISRGRTIRQFVGGVLIVPTVVSMLWFAILGGAGINLEFTNQANIVGENIGAAEAFFNALQAYPGFIVTGILVMVLVAIFWVSGADASALVLAMLSSRGAIEPKNWLVALWAAASAAVAGVLLWVGGLTALQTFTILVASPFVIVMAGLCWSIYVDLRRDPLRARQAAPVRLHSPSPGSYVTAGQRQERGREQAGDESQQTPEPAGGDGGDRGNGGQRIPQPAGAVPGNGDRS